MDTADFLYELPEASIAQSAIEPRHDARLLDTRSMTDHRVKDLADLLEPGDLVVVNRTRVRQARLSGTRPTGGAVEVLLLRRLDERRWEALARPSRKLKPGSTVAFDTAQARVTTNVGQGLVVLESDEDLEQVAAVEGTVPLPPYFHGSLADSERYQTVFADRVGSAAAPTAGLHFTDSTFATLAARNIAIAKVELEVGLDTFRPITTDRIEDHTMHTERVRVGPDAVEAITKAQAGGGRIVAVGTTVVRSLESAAAGGDVFAFDDDTDLFIHPGYRFRVVDAVLTNFHVPGSTLVVMMAAVLGADWRRVYTEALDRGYRFLSFGDAMLAEVPR
jgi:S-adenosylmethionine:tRNA ribosyltransferase-isomerase